MRRPAARCIGPAAALLFGWSLCVGRDAGQRPAVDEQAMREAMSASLGDDEQFSSSASYAHYLRSRLAHHEAITAARSTSCGWRSPPTTATRS